jgi:hypothetical protein
VELHDATIQVGGDRRHPGGLERACGNHDLIRLVRAVVELDHVPVLASPHGPDAAAELDRQLELLHVVLRVANDVVAIRVAVRVARKRQSRQAVVAHGREELERVPAAAPRSSRDFRGFEDGEVASLLSEEVADGKAGLAAADDEHVVPFRHAVTSKLNIMPLS